MKKAKKPESASHRAVAEIALMSEAAADIKAQDCAAFSVLAFNEGQADPPWDELGAKAIGKFMRFGWAAYHALGGLGTDWEKVHKRLLGKLSEAEPATKPSRKRRAAQ